MRVVLLDGEQIHNREQLHAEIKEQLELSDDYGCNLDALWDVLTGWIEMPLTIRWLHAAESERKLGDYSRSFMELLWDAEQQIEGFQVQFE